jgi:hypothetical protein
LRSRGRILVVDLAADIMEVASVAGSMAVDSTMADSGACTTAASGIRRPGISSIHPASIRPV